MFYFFFISGVWHCSRPHPPPRHLPPQPRVALRRDQAEEQGMLLGGDHQVPETGSQDVQLPSRWGEKAFNYHTFIFFQLFFVNKYTFPLRFDLRQDDARRLREPDRRGGQHGPVQDGRRHHRPGEHVQAGQHHRR